MNETLPSSLHFVGAGGIGMSALAQMAASLGCLTSGSDRAINSPENRRIFDALSAKGVALYPQDGSRYQTSPLPEAIVYSTAIEEENPDFQKAPNGTVRLHRSEAMKLLVDRLGASVLAVTGSCGKTSVSAWLAEALDRLNASPTLISGGLAKYFIRDSYAGNYAPGSGNICVLEADESDKSLLNYTADRAIILNIGTDHYSKEELANVFRAFLTQTRISAVVEDEVLKAVGTECVRHLRQVSVFSTAPDAPETLHGYPVIRVTEYSASAGIISAGINGLSFRLPAPGLHNAANAAAVCALLLQIGYSMEETRAAVQTFSGVWRRFDFAGRNSKGTQIYDDYAHNVEKICSCIKSARAVCSGRLALLFQPHGYGPFGFMRNDLFPALETVLEEGDQFCFLPVYYAGGTSSFQPKAEDVASEYETRHPGRYRYFPDRSAAETWLKLEFGSDDVILVMGARDNSLSDWTKKMADQA